MELLRAFLAESEKLTAESGILGSPHSSLFTYRLFLLNVVSYTHGYGGVCFFSKSGIFSLDLLVQVSDLVVPISDRLFYLDYVSDLYSGKMDQKSQVVSAGNKNAQRDQ
ncbi:MAG: hypothetical protein NTY66_00795 [Candidatus Vogelbacteria bacterium]|nr:hypothetical protein [Candidatus Vogelbacteria bacterium]